MIAILKSLFNIFYWSYCCLLEAVDKLFPDPELDPWTAWQCFCEEMSGVGKEYKRLRHQLEDLAAEGHDVQQISTELDKAVRAQILAICDRYGPYFGVQSMQPGPQLRLIQGGKDG